MTLTFVRTTEMIQARWVEIDEDKAEWRIPADRMKMRDPHVVPLSTQAMAVLGELREINGHRDLVFYSPRGKSGHISNNTMLYALYRMGYHSRMTGHSFRGLASHSLTLRMSVKLRSVRFSRLVISVAGVVYRRSFMTKKGLEFLAYCDQKVADADWTVTQPEDVKKPPSKRTKKPANK